MAAARIVESTTDETRDISWYRGLISSGPRIFVDYTTIQVYDPLDQVLNSALKSLLGDDTKEFPIVEIPERKILCFTARTPAYVNIEQPIQWFSVNENCVNYISRRRGGSTTLTYRVKRPLRVVVWNAVTMHLAFRYADPSERALLAQITGVSLTEMDDTLGGNISYSNKDPNRVRYQDTFKVPRNLSEIPGRVLIKIIYRLASKWGQAIDGLFFDYRLICPGELVSDYFLYADNYSELALIRGLQDSKIVRINPELATTTDKNGDIYDLVTAVMSENNTAIGWPQWVRTWQDELYGHIPKQSNLVLQRVIDLRRIPRDLPDYARSVGYLPPLGKRRKY